MAISLFLGGLISRPLGKIFASFGEDASSDRLIGCIGTVSSAFIPHQHRNKIGQVDVIDSARNLVTINATLPDWANVLPRRGEKVLVIERWEQYYLVVAKDSSDQEHWLENLRKVSVWLSLVMKLKRLCLLSSKSPFYQSTICYFGSLSSNHYQSLTSLN
jgi:hypothetical protein